MVDVKIKSRPIGASAQLQRNGRPQVASRTGGTVSVVTGASEEGFNPLDLMFASLSACLVLSARIAASKLGLLDRFESCAADVTGSKAEEEPSRLAALQVRMSVRGDLTPEERKKIVEMAEDICTVSNTLRTPPAISVSLE